MQLWQLSCKPDYRENEGEVGNVVKKAIATLETQSSWHKITPNKSGQDHIETPGKISLQVTASSLANF